MGFVNEQGPGRCIVALFIAIGSWAPTPALAQIGAAIGNVSQRPFVVGIIPVVGRNGAVGGVSIDPKGILQQADTDDISKLRRARLGVGRSVKGSITLPARVRCVSLKRLEEALADHILQRTAIPDDVKYLAGLQRITHVFVYPDQQDIVLAGPAEGWVVSESGDVLGAASSRPVMHLDDLLVALRTARNALNGGLSCSIDPAAEGLTRLSKAAASRSFRGDANSLRKLEEALGPQTITLKGIPATSRFARVLVAADFRMKRLAMGLEPSPVRKLPSYLQLVRADKGAPPRNMAPRWWMALNYDRLSRDADGLAWRLEGPGVKTLTEAGFVEASGGIVDTGAAHPIAQQWADAMTDQYEALCGHIPVFADLRNCMDLAVVAAIISAHDLSGAAGWDLPLLFHDQLRPAELNPARQVASQASLVRKGRSWIVAVSGGVSIDSWSVLEQVEVNKSLDRAREISTPPNKNWWWNAVK